MWKSQKERILTHLQRYGKITVPQMMRMGIAKYTNRICDLRNDGHDIFNELKYSRKKKCYTSKYYLVRY